MSWKKGFLDGCLVLPWVLWAEVVAVCGPNLADGFITEGSSNNAYIVKDGKVITRELSNDILHGITRKATLELAATTQIEVIERAFTLEEAFGADEAFVTSATTFVTPVVEIDGNMIGDGKPGPVAKRLREIYINNALENLE